MTPIEIAGLTLAVIAGLLAWWTHYEWLAVWWWPLVGSEWRYARRLSVPADTIPDGPDEAWREMVALGQELEPLDRDEWEQLDPDTAAETLIAEWHDEDGERPASHTDQFKAITLDMPRAQREALLQWDWRVRSEQILDEFDRWRQEFFADWRAELEQRRAA